jgi:hypothetical protein
LTKRRNWGFSGDTGCNGGSIGGPTDGEFWHPMRLCVQQIGRRGGEGIWLKPGDGGPARLCVYDMERSSSSGGLAHSSSSSSGIYDVTNSR